ncbi:MAG: outer membrane protein assembly factor BamD [Candidatus Omnitrophota bacterium]
MIKTLISLLIIFIFLSEGPCYAFWVWTPKSKTAVNPKFAVKDDPYAQFEWAMQFFKQYEFGRAAEEFSRLTKNYPDSEWAAEAQYYAGRSYEEMGKYYFAFQNYQKTIDDYPYSRRVNEIIKRQYNIANIFQTKETSKLMDLELTLSIDRAVTIYKQIIENSPFGEYADKSLYKSAECYRRMMQHKDAMEAYERIVNDYPDSKLVPEAKYQLAYTKYEASLEPEYDQESTDEAINEFKEISDTTAIPAIAMEAKKVFKELKNRKAGSELKVAEFYERQKKYKSAVMYYEEILRQFPNTDAAEYAQGKIKVLIQKGEAG